MENVYQRYVDQHVRIRLRNGYYFFAKLLSVDDNLLHFIDRKGMASSIAPSEIQLIRVLDAEQQDHYFHKEGNMKNKLEDEDNG